MLYSGPPIDNKDDWHRFRNATEPSTLFLECPDELCAVRLAAEGLASAIEAMSPLIERYTAVVCPSCVSVCCINRHSYHDVFDLVLLYALGYEAPPSQQDIDDSVPCRFLGEKGCIFPRSLRPYRCTWYFCDCLLERLDEAPPREYRAFMNTLAGLTEKREEMIREYFVALDRITSRRQG